MNDNSVFTFEDERSYVNPQTGLDESNTFIEQFRNIQAQGNQQINQDTYNLGTPTTPNLGGLTGAEDLWQARYQTPQVNQQVASLKQQAQQTALNTALGNLQGMWQNRYNQAKRRLEDAQHRYTTKPSSPSDTFDQGVQNVPITEGNLGNIDELGNINAVVSGPAGTTATDEGAYRDYINENGETVRQYRDGRTEIISGGKITNVGNTAPKKETVNEAIKRLESSGKTVTNKTITADKNGNVILTWKDQQGNEGSETVKVDINIRNFGL